MDNNCEYICIKIRKIQVIFDNVLPFSSGSFSFYENLYCDPHPKLLLTYLDCTEYFPCDHRQLFLKILDDIDICMSHSYFCNLSQLDSVQSFQYIRQNPHTSKDLSDVVCIRFYISTCKVISKILFECIPKRISKMINFRSAEISCWSSKVQASAKNRHFGSI